MTRRTGLGGLIIAGLMLAGCTAEPGRHRPRPRRRPAPAPIGTTATSPTGIADPVRRSVGDPAPPEPHPHRRPTAKPTAKPNPISVQALIEKKYDGRDLRLGRQIGSTSAYKRYLVSYRGDGRADLTGVMNVPDRQGPVPGAGAQPRLHRPRHLRRRPGHARASRTTWPGAASSCCTSTTATTPGPTTTRTRTTSCGCRYAVDTINAVKAVKSSKLTFLDRDRVGMLGRSMGGNVTLTALVAQPDLVDAAVLYASTSSLAADNWRQFSQDAEDRQGTNRRIARTYGLPEDNPKFWRAASPRPYLDRVTEPVLLHHGTAGRHLPVAWARSVTGAWRPRARTSPCGRTRVEDHRIEGAAFARSIDRTADFFSENSARWSAASRVDGPLPNSP